MHLGWFVIVLVLRLLASDGNRIEMPLIILIEVNIQFIPVVLGPGNTGIRGLSPI